MDPEISAFIESLKLYDHLWQKDLKTNYMIFHQNRPSIHQWKEEVMDLVQTENEVSTTL